MSQPITLNDVQNALHKINELENATAGFASYADIEALLERIHVLEMRFREFELHAPAQGEQSSIDTSALEARVASLQEQVVAQGKLIEAMRKRKPSLTVKKPYNQSDAQRTKALLASEEDISDHLVARRLDIPMTAVAAYRGMSEEDIAALPNI